jgi:hypothetical protein
MGDGEPKDDGVHVLLDDQFGPLVDPRSGRSRSEAPRPTPSVIEPNRL